MKRSEIVQSLLNLYDNPSYLEIGVFRGDTFEEVTAGLKVAVDPRFHFETSPSDVRLYYEMPSDKFFFNHGLDRRFDVIFLDGLHTFDQTLRDFTSAVSILNEGGVIVLDDVRPSCYSASLPDFALSKQIRQITDPGSSAWMGDVYRLVFFIANYYRQFSCATVAEGKSQTIVWKEPRSAPKFHLSVEEISRLEYSATISMEAVYNILPLATIIEHVNSVRRV